MKSVFKVLSNERGTSAIEYALIASLISVAAIAGYFAYHAWRDPIPGLPRVRAVQRRQLRSSLMWAAQRLHLPP